MIEEVGSEILCRRATDFKSEYDRLADLYGRRMTQSIALFYLLMMVGIGLGMLDVPYVPKTCGVLVVLSFIRLCYYSSKFNTLIQLEKEE